MEPAAAEAYVAALKQDADFAKFDGMFANVPHGGGVSTNAATIGRLLLSRAIVSGDIEATVNRFIEYVTTNAAPAVAVYGVSGVSVEAPISLGPDVQLVPMTAVAPSMQRSMALGESHLPYGVLRGPVRAALVTNFTYQPVFYRPKTPQPPEDMAAKVPARAAHMLLEEAASLLGLAGTPAVYRMFWVQPVDWLMSAGMAGGWQYSSSDGPHSDQAVPQDIGTTAKAYFALQPQIRGKFLRIPLDRLNRAILEGDFADKAIDLGIALEALLLHDSGNPTDRGELKFRLGLRGAWLLGDNAAERKTIQKGLADLYDLRSRAVHSGLIERSAKTGTTVHHASELCAALIERMIELRCRVDWGSLVAGGPAQRA